MTNFNCIIGRVCTYLEIKSNSNNVLCAKTRLRFRNSKKQPMMYIDLYGFNDMAKQMQLTCLYGNLVYVEYTLTEREYLTDKKRIKKLKIYFVITKIDVISKGTPLMEENDLRATLHIINELDPKTYLDDIEEDDYEVIEEKKGENKNG